MAGRYSIEGKVRLEEEGFLEHSDDGCDEGREACDGVGGNDDLKVCANTGIYVACRQAVCVVRSRMFVDQDGEVYGMSRKRLSSASMHR